MQTDPENGDTPVGDSTGASVVRSMPRCPGCGWQDVRLSRAQGPLDAALAAISVAPFRCRSCGLRFYRFHRRPERD